jgi:hypothetical protein
MEVAEAIAQARETAERMTRLARILARIKSVILSTGTRLRLSDHQVDFYCMTEADATKLAAALPGKLELTYRGASTSLGGTIVIQGLEFNFSVQTIRKIRLEQCEMKSKNRHVADWMEGMLIFNGLLLARLNYQKRDSRKAKRMLWEKAIREKAGNERLEKFDFVL